MGHPPPRPYARRLSALVGGLVTLSMTCVVGAAGAAPGNVPPARVGIPTAGTTANASSVDAKAKAETTATERARRTGVPVPVPELTTETDTVSALPNGTLALKRTIEPSRTKKNGVWRDLDPTLTRAADGTVRPTSTTGDLVLGGGGNRLLATMNNNGRKLTLSWPTALPEPILSGDGALYPGVLPDVDLKVVAGEQGGFAHTLVVKTAQAARNPQLATLKLGLTTDGLSVATNPDGSLTARAADDKVAFTAPTATMWDSRTIAKPVRESLQSTPDNPGTTPTTELASTERQPGARASTAPLKTDITAGTLTLTPDPGLLTAPDTVFPLYIDPSWVPMRDNASLYGWAQEAYPDTPGYGRTDYQPGAGYQRWRTKTGLERTYYRVDYNRQGRLDGKTINRVTFNTTQVDSAIFSCENQYAQPVSLYLTNNTLTTNTSWNNRPTEVGLWGTASVPSSRVDSHCGNRLVDFDITANIAPHQNWEYLTFSVQGKESPRSTSNDGFKRFSRTAADTFIYIEYNTPPDTPTNLRMNPTPVNGDSNGCGYIGAVNPAVGGVTLYATLTDADGQDPDGHFVVRDVADNSVTYDGGWTPRGANGHEAQAGIPTGKLLGGHTYRWSVQTGDGITASAWADGCTFTVDDTPPSAPTVSSTDYPVNGGGKRTNEKGTFMLTATDGQSGVDYFEYALDGPIPVGGASRGTWDAARNTWTIKDLSIGLWSTHHLFVQTVDEAGNRSQPTTYSFYVAANLNVTPQLGDINGDTRIDLVTITDSGELKMYGTDTNPAEGGLKIADAGAGPAPAGSGYTWSGSLVTHRGGAGIQRDNLYAYADTRLYMYRNNGARPDGTYFAAGGSRSTVPRPSATRCLPQGACPGYATGWANVTGLLAAGNVDNDSDEAGSPLLDLLTQETDGTDTRLWLFHGTSSGASFDHATHLGGGWRNLDIIAPGDVTGDGLPDLWARDRVTGQLYQYASKRNTDGTADVAALGNHSGRTLIGSGFDSSAYPELRSDGDLDNDKLGDLWARDSGGRLYLILGKVPGADANAFRPPVLVTDTLTSWNTCKPFKSGIDPTKTFDICGPILAKYEASGGPDGEMRLPVSGTEFDADGVGRWADFQADSGNGTAAASINYSPYTGAWIVRGTVRQKWLDLGGPSGLLGYPVTDETKMYDGGGTYLGAISRFAGGATSGPGAITATNAGTHEMHGDIYQHWQLLGGTRGFLGFPSTDETQTPNKPGFFNHFLAPGADTVTGSIYASPATGAKAVYGSIRRDWAAHGWENSDLGFPTTDEYALLGGRRSDFQNGYIHQTWHTGTYTLYGTDRLVASADFDGDHLGDAVTIDDKGSLWLRRGNPDGTFQGRVGMWPDTTWTGTAAITAGDFNGDGNADLVASTVGGNLWLYLGDSHGGLSEHKPLWTDGTWNHANGIAAGDFDGDGKLDIANIWTNGELRLYRGDGQGHIATSIPLGVDASWGSIKKITAGDFNKDGKTDLAGIWANGALRLYTGNGNATLNESIALWPDNSWGPMRAIAAGDINPNGRSDMIALWDDGTVHTYKDILTGP
ncbi:FG-GAP-like repeat-containing protein [Embleya sp. NBC_00888]|uniref:FG-GAP-like repeat-containing protein n=1 Tax=Embleya sp. NBC_00888 TaxID=2975960 RepID=UPI003867FF7D|nr:FG-GAP-like repeat-containing protein [Embleya sp. NBC_00888]